MKTYFFIILFVMSFVYSEEAIKVTLKEYLNQVRNHYQVIKIAKKDVGIALANYHEFKDSENSPSLSADYTISQSTNRLETPITPFINNSILGHDVGVSYNQNFLQTGTGINLSYNYKVLGISAVSLGNVFNYNEYENKVALTLSQSLLRNGPIGWAGGKRLETSRTSVKLARSMFNSQLEQYLLIALQQYFSYELTQKSIQLSIETVNDSRKILKKNLQKSKLGSADITAVYDSEILLIENKEELLRYKNNLAEIKENLLNLMGKISIDSKDVSFEFLTKLETVVNPIDSEAVYSNAFLHRKDIEQFKLQKRMKKLNLDIARMAQMPLLDLNLQLSYSRITTNTANINNNIFIGQPDFQLGLKFEMPLDPRSFKTITEKAKIEYQKASDNLKKLNKDITLEINNFIRQIDYLRKRVKESKLALRIQTRNTRTYRKNFNNGKIDLQRYITSLEQLRRRQTIYLQSIFDYENTMAQLKIAQGKFLSDYDIRELQVAAKVK